MEILFPQIPPWEDPRRNPRPIPAQMWKSHPENVCTSHNNHNYI